jgi:hypothetical protein
LFFQFLRRQRTLAGLGPVHHQLPAPGRTRRGAKITANPDESHPKDSVRPNGTAASPDTKAERNPTASRVGAHCRWRNHLKARIAQLNRNSCKRRAKTAPSVLMAGEAIVNRFAQSNRGGASIGLTRPPVLVDIQPAPIAVADSAERALGRVFPLPKRLESSASMLGSSSTSGIARPDRQRNERGRAVSLPVYLRLAAG